MIKLLRTATSGVAAAAILAATAILAAGTAHAHHSTAMFNMRKNVTLKGTIRRFDWQNPHTWIVFDVPNAKGGVDQYGIEGMSPNYLVRVGWNIHTLSPGDKVELTIHPLKDGQKGGFDVSVKFPTGKVMYNLPHGPP
ncbi:MAG: DUF6152 family protein [Steroidobacteraceae bacterium]